MSTIANLIQPNNGFFAMLSEYDTPWKNVLSNEDILALDNIYYYNQSANKTLSPIGEMCINNNTLLALSIKAMYTRYNTKWQRLWADYTAEYNPIHNYSMTESGTDKSINTPDITDRHTYDKTITHTTDMSDTQTRNTTTTQTNDITDTQTHDTDSAQSGTTTTPNSDNIYGFNSAEISPNTTQSSTVTPNTHNTVTGTITNAQNGTITDSDKGTITNAQSGTVTDSDSGTITDNKSGTDSTITTHNFNRDGNIGVTTTQQMITSDISLWDSFDYYQKIFDDFDSIFTLGVYE